jgi:hypothetical protein
LSPSTLQHRDGRTGFKFHFARRACIDFTRIHDLLNDDDMAIRMCATGGPPDALRRFRPFLGKVDGHGPMCRQLRHDDDDDDRMITGTGSLGASARAIMMGRATELCLGRLRLRTASE